MENNDGLPCEAALRRRDVALHPVVEAIEGEANVARKKSRVIHVVAKGRFSDNREAGREAFWLIVVSENNLYRCLTLR